MLPLLGSIYKLDDKMLFWYIKPILEKITSSNYKLDARYLSIAFLYLLRELIN